MSIIKDLLFYVFSFIVLTILFLLLVNVNNFSFITVFYYRMTFILLLSVVIGLAMMLIYRKFFKVSFKDLLLSLTLFFSFHFIFISVAVVSLDRSVSVLILSEMADFKEKIFTKNDLDQFYLDVYYKKYDPINRRLLEQISSGNIEKIDEGYRITSNGIKTVNIFRMTSKIYPVSDKFIYPNKKD